MALQVLSELYIRRGNRYKCKDSKYNILSINSLLVSVTPPNKITFGRRKLTISLVYSKLPVNYLKRYYEYLKIPLQYVKFNFTIEM